MKSILFVDDHKPLARLSCEILQRAGFCAEFACDGTEALVKFKQGSFDLVVTDYRMEGMNGLELARRLRQQAPELPIVIVTGCADLEPCTEVNAWIAKQDMFPRLVETIRQLLREGVPAPTADND
jgi:CheY-like chemotaxis protein